MASKCAECLQEGFRAAQQLSITKLQCCCSLGHRLSSQKEDCECPQGCLRSTGVLEGLSQPATAHEPCCLFSLRHAWVLLLFVLLGVFSYSKS